jgi:hypothetical protein
MVTLRANWVIFSILAALSMRCQKYKQKYIMKGYKLDMQNCVILFSEGLILVKKKDDQKCF